MDPVAGMRMNGAGEPGPLGVLKGEITKLTGVRGAEDLL